MNYPVWYIPSVGGGLLIALIAILHVFISHFAVGGGLYLVLTERMGIRAKNRAILDFTKGHAKFFLLVTLVLGGMTGVGIWFIISLVQPAATSLLIHTFVFGWATEWVFFSWRSPPSSSISTPSTGWTRRPTRRSAGSISAAPG